MKQFFVVLLVTFVSVATTFAQKSSKIEFQETLHDFGSFSEDMKKVTCKFTFTNTGDVPLAIVRVTAACGCTQPEYPEEPVMPGKTGTISVTYNAEGAPGSFQKTINVYSTAKPEKVVLSIKGTVIPSQSRENPSYPYKMGDLHLSNTTLPFFDVYLDKPKTEKIPVINEGKKLLSLAFDHVPRHLSVVAVPSVLKPKEKGEIVITYRAEKVKDWGLRRDEFFVAFSGENKFNPEYKIAVTANILEDFSDLSQEELEKAPKLELSQQKIDFGAVKGTDKVKRDLKVTNKGKKPLSIRKIQTDTDIVSVQASSRTVAPGKSETITLTLDPSGIPGKMLNKLLSIVTNDPLNPFVSVRLVGTFE